MTGAADSLDAGLVSEPLERHEPRFEAEYAFGAGFRAWRAESEKNKTDVLVDRGAPLRKIRVAERDIERQNRVLYSVVKTVERSEGGRAPRARSFGQDERGGHAMGRGRQKAKATRQAREMKYFSPETDYSALERELSSAKKTKSSDSSRRRYDDEDDYSAYAEKYASYEDEA